AGNRANTYLEYMRSFHAKEASVIGDDLYDKSAEKAAALEEVLPGDRDRREIKEADSRVEKARMEKQFLERVKEQFYKGRELPKAHNAGFQRHIELTLNLLRADGSLPAELRDSLVRTGEALYKDYSEAATKDKAVERINDQLADAKPSSSRTNRVLDLPYDPFPSAGELKRISEGGESTERTESGVKTRRRSIVSEWSQDRPPTKEEILEVLKDRIDELRKRHEEMTRRGHEVPKEEKVLLDHFEKAHSKYAASGPGAAERFIELGFKGGRAVAGTAIGAAIVASAILGWYIATHEGGRVPSELQSLLLPGV
ncbi:MAG: hypothetical protein K2Z81_04500, partial [Cyanobacteria bacterium]|nr:hypothetical protein [Cyanobacteriota bacterium]